MNKKSVIVFLKEVETPFSVSKGWIQSSVPEFLQRGENFL
jgi:hypothetical protein